jgi:hypothetical protein
MPFLASAATYLRPGPLRPALWAAALVLPAAVALGVQGTVLHDPRHGASFWILGEMFIVIQGLVAFAAANAAGSLARRRG